MLERVLVVAALAAALLSAPAVAQQQLSPDERAAVLLTTADPHDLVDAGVDDRKGLVPQAGLQAVGDGGGLLDRDDPPGLPRAIGVVSAGRLTAQHQRLWAEVFDRQERSRQEPPAADRGKDRVELGLILEQFEGGGSLPGPSRWPRGPHPQQTPSPDSAARPLRGRRTRRQCWGG